MNIRKWLAMVAVASLGLSLSAATTYTSVSGGRTWSYTLDKSGNATLVGVDNAVGALTLPSSLDGHAVTAVGEKSFKNLSQLQALRIPDSVVTVGYGAFGGCTALGEIVTGDGVTSFGGSTGTLTSYDDNGVFNGCTSLTNVTFGSGLRTLNGHAFANCTKLTRVVVPDGVETIANNCFYGCTSLAKVTIGNGVTSIGKYAFAKCPALRSLNIGTAILTISDNAFNGVLSLRYVYFHGLNPPTIGKDVFSGAPAPAIVYVADGGTGWNGTEPGLPEKWNGFTIKWGSEYSSNIEAPYDLVFTQPDGWPASMFLTSSPSSHVAQTRFLAGDVIYLRYAFVDAWADEDVVAEFANGVRVADASVVSPQTVLDLSDLLLDGCVRGSTVQRTVKIEGLGFADGYRLDVKLDDEDVLEETDKNNNFNGCSFVVAPSIFVSFVSEDAKVAERRYEPNVAYGSLPEPETRFGYEFAGWYTKAEGGGRSRPN